MVELDIVIKEFVAESGEMLDQLERDLIVLEQHPSAPETLASLFRSLHTIKGAAGFMGLAKLGALAHSGESVLSRLRDGSLTINPPLANGLLALSDCLRTMLSHVDQTGREGDVDGSAIVDELTRLQAQSPLRPDPSPDRPAAPADTERPTTTANVRVSVDQLDTLMNLVGELVIARNAIVQLSAADGQSALLGTSQRLSVITTQLQEGIMKTRMQPIDHAWSKLPRIVRDAAEQCGKRVCLEISGKDTELDRTLIEAIQGPLTHVVRNCVDHGLEAPEQRLAAGKPAEGRLSLRAFHEGGHVTIEVADDGAGIDVAAITRKALQSGLITPEQALRMSEQDAINLIFLPGLSTAAAITSISGRGVGMDVVKTNIEQIGGKVSIQSEPGVGTTIGMRIPLTLAIVTALVVSSGEQHYAIPQVNVVELADITGKVELMGDVAVYRLRGELLPLAWLTDHLTATTPARRIAAQDTVHVVVLHAHGRKFGLIVDEIHDAQEIVVKPLNRCLRGTAIFAGATIMGNGRVVLILDVLALAVNAGARCTRRDTSTQAADDTAAEVAEPMESLLLFAGAGEARMAVPLSQITRLEEFSRASVERAGERRGVQYCGSILPLEDIASLFPAAHPAAWPASRTTGALQALVYSNSGRRLALVVDQILDTVEARVTTLRPDNGRRLAESMVIDGKVTQILDLDALCSHLGTRA